MESDKAVTIYETCLGLCVEQKHRKYTTSNAFQHGRQSVVMASVTHYLDTAFSDSCKVINN